MQDGAALRNDPLLSRTVISHEAGVSWDHRQLRKIKINDNEM